MLTQYSWPVLNQLLSPWNNLQERSFHGTRKQADLERASQVFLGSLFQTRILLKGSCHRLARWETGGTSLFTFDQTNWCIVHPSWLLFWKCCRLKLFQQCVCFVVEFGIANNIVGEPPHPQCHRPQRLRQLGCQRRWGFASLSKPGPNLIQTLSKPDPN